MTENEYIKASCELLERWREQTPNQAFAKDGMLRCIFQELDDLCFPDYKLKNGYAILESEKELGRVKIIAAYHPSYIKGAEINYNSIIENYRKVSQLCD